MTNDNEHETIRAQRRRRGGPEDSGERERAAAPQRQRPESPAAPPEAGVPRPSGVSGGVPRPSGGGGGFTLPPSLSGLRLPGGGKPSLLILIIGGAVLLCIVCALIYFVSQMMGGLTLPEPSGYTYDYPTESVERPTVAPAKPTVAPAKPTTQAPKTPVRPTTSGERKTWLVMLYQDADDKILEQDIYIDLNEAERVGSSDNVHIVAQMDRYRGGYYGDGDWTSTKRFYVTQDDDLQRIGSQEVADLGEVNMADGNALVDFVTWAVANYPAEKYVLILSDHGMGWPGGWSDPDPRAGGDRSIPLGSALGNQLYLHELDQALTDIRNQTGIEKFELIGMDACLMGHLEVFGMLAQHARYAVASQETEPSLGWAYTSFLKALETYPTMGGADLGQLIVKSYIAEDQRIVDEQARAELLRQSAPMGGFFGMPSAAQLTQQFQQGVTLTAVDLSAIPPLVNSLNNFAFALQSANQRGVAQARSYAQSFTNIFGNNVPPAYIDLGNFVQLLRRESGSQAVSQAAAQVLAALDRAVIAEKHGAQKPGATGISIYFPNSQLYASPITGYQSYNTVAGYFARTSLWDDFLAYHYTGRTFEPASANIVVPDRSATINPPGAGGIEVSPITLSSNVAAPGKPTLLSIDIRGENVGYIYLFVGYYDRAANSIMVVDSDYLESQETREIDGVYYPVWSRDREFTMEFEWEPIVFAINDGSHVVMAHFEPQSFGATFEEAVYTVDGIYTYADSGETRYARLYFVNGVLQRVYGFTGENGNGAPREITPQTGDTFTVLEKWLDLNGQGQVEKVSRQAGDTLTFGNQMFTWKQLDAAPGNYLVGFIVEDLDGNTYPVYTQVTVQ
ncbi:MAG TPA: clostripain-related cysteine peptidase [Anaerolineae bacterium]|nr:clostripain-related cysteine peptidase [Anaerolineae bacterium]HQK13051.1 clostripain-related cysteine peptidase [Anaerolineae bacterium]